MAYSMLPPLLKHVQSLGHKVFDGGHAYNLNIIGIRSASRESDSFDDLICCAYRRTKDGPFVIEYWPCTTDPGKFCLNNPEVYGTSAGTAIVVEGQYRGAYVLGLHRGKYKALVQQGAKIKVYRDSNKDDILDLDPTTEMEGFYGCNLHKAGAMSTRVGRWSAGCQVFARSADFQRLIFLAEKQIATHPNWAKKFTYTLIREF